MHPLVIGVLFIVALQFGAFGLAAFFVIVAMGSKSVPARLQQPRRYDRARIRPSQQPTWYY